MRSTASRVLMLGATGTIGRAAARALVREGYQVVSLQRNDTTPEHNGAIEVRRCDVRDPRSLAEGGIRGERFDLLLSCMASRTGAPDDAWAIDHQAHIHALNAAQDAGVGQMVLLSAICVQKPRLQFQRAKLAFEKTLMASGLTYSIVRPTAYFKSLSGQIGRLKQGKPFLLFGDGTQTACKPISDDDLARYLVDCIGDEARHNQILPIGGPGPAITPRQQGEELFALLGKEPAFRSVPLPVLNSIVGGLNTLATILPPLRGKAEFGRIAQYYATESMLLWDEKTGRYDADATPSFGTKKLFDHYERLIRGDVTDDRGDHALF